MPRFSRGMLGLAVGSGLLGISLLTYSLIDQKSEWASNVAIEVGATLLLFAPLLLTGRHIERRLDDVQAIQKDFKKQQEQTTTKIADLTEETASNFATLTEEVQQSFAELKVNRDPLSDAVVARLAESRKGNVEKFDKLDNDRTRESVFEAVNRAVELGIVFAGGCRIRLYDSRLFVWFEPFNREDFSDEAYFVALQSSGGHEVGRIRWEEEWSAEDFLVAIGDATQRAGYYPGDDDFNPGRIFKDLRDFLDFAHTISRKTGSVGREIDPLVELCLPQWAITEASIVSIDPKGWWEIPLGQIYEIDYYTRVSELPWVDRDCFTEAFDHGKSLYELRRLAVAPPLSDTPPF